MFFFLYQAPCGTNVAAADCRLAGCPAGTVMIRASDVKDTSFRDECFQCPVGKFQMFSTNHYNPDTLQPDGDDLEDPARMCAPCPGGTSCPRSTAQQKDFGFTVGIHLIPTKGHWVNSVLIHAHTGTFIKLTNSLPSRRAANETAAGACSSGFCSKAAETVTVHRCKTNMCNHTGQRPKEWSDRLKPENPDWMCGESKATGLACGLCKKGSALEDGECENCGNADSIWVLQLCAVLLGIVLGGAIWYGIVWRGIFTEEVDHYEAGRTAAVGPPAASQHEETEGPENPDQNVGDYDITAKKEEFEEHWQKIQNAPDDGKEKLEGLRKRLADGQKFVAGTDEDTMSGGIEDISNRVKEFFGPVWVVVVLICSATVGSEGTDPESIRRALMGFFKIVMSYFQVTASFLQNFAVDWGSKLDRFLNALR